MDNLLVWDPLKFAPQPVNSLVLEISQSSPDTDDNHCSSEREEIELSRSLTLMAESSGTFSATTRTEKNNIIINMKDFILFITLSVKS